MDNTCIAVIYHSGYGHTARQAEAVRAGIERVDGTQCLLLTVEEAPARWNDLISAEAIIFGTPTYVGGAQSNVDQGADLAPTQSDLATARHLGQRVAEATLQFVRGRTLKEEPAIPAWRTANDR